MFLIEFHRQVSRKSGILAEFGDSSEIMCEKNVIQVYNNSEKEIPQLGWNFPSANYKLKILELKRILLTMIVNKIRCISTRI